MPLPEFVIAFLIEIGAAKFDPPSRGGWSLYRPLSLSMTSPMKCDAACVSLCVATPA